MSAVLVSQDELTYERKFHQDTILKAAAFRQEWIDERREQLMRNPLDLLCDMVNANALLRSLVDAQTNGSVSALREAVTDFTDELHGYATDVAEHQFYGKGY